MAGPKAVEYIVPEHPALPRTLRGRLLEMIKTEAAGIVEGVATDWPNYKFRVGRTQGLRDAVKVCEQAETDLSQ